MLRTNGSHGNRELYDDPVSISYLMQCPAFTKDTIGVLEYFYSITFSGQVGPGLQSQQPQTVTVQIPASKPKPAETAVLYTLEQAMALTNV